jgi:hypothetical protein
MSDGFPLRRLLRLAGGTRIVYQTTAAGAPAVVRVMVRPVPLALDRVVQEVVAGRTGAADLPAEIAPFFEACGARSRLPSQTAGFPDILRAGVSAMSLPGRSAPPAGHGHAFVLGRWIEGHSLARAHTSLDLADRLRCLAAIGRALDRAHGAHLAYGRLRAAGVVVDGEGPWLVELEGFARAAPGDPRLAEDVLRFGELGALLLEEELARGAPELASWSAALDACRRPVVAERPTMADVLVWLGLLGAREVGGATIAVPDPTIGARPVALDAPTEQVPDPSAARRHSPANLAWVLLLALVVVLAIAAVASGR